MLSLHFCKNLCGKIRDFRRGCLGTFPHPLLNQWEGEGEKSTRVSCTPSTPTHASLLHQIFYL